MRFVGQHCLRDLAQATSSRHIVDYKAGSSIASVIIMPNQELFGLAGLLLCRTQEDYNRAFSVLYANPVRSIESLTALLKVKELPDLSSEQLEQAKLSASTFLNYMLKVGVKEVDGVEELGTFWDVFFDWTIAMPHKLNLEDTFQYLYKFWYAKHEKIFEQGMAKVTRFLNTYSNNDCQLNTSVKLAVEKSEFFLWMDGHSPISNVLQSLLLVGRCCMSSLTCEKVYFEGFATVMDSMTALFRAIKKWHPEARVEMAKLETINWIIDCLEAADLDEKNRRTLIEEAYKRGRMSDMIIDTYKKGGRLHQGMEKGLCWLCVGGNLQQRSNLLREKEEMAKIHLRFVMNGKNFYDRIHTFLEKEEEFQPSIISTLYCFASSRQRYNKADSFVSSLLELYIAHFKHYPQVFTNIYSISFSHIVLPLMSGDHHRQQELQSDPLFLLHLLENLRSGHTLDIPIVKAAALLRYIALKYHVYYDKIIQNILKILQSQEFDEEFWELKRPSLNSCLLIVITLSPNLKDDKLNLQRLLLVFNKGIEIMLSNFSLCLVTFLFKTLIHDPSVSERFYDFAKEGLQRNTHVKQFMMELYIEDQAERFSQSFLGSAFKGLFLQKEEDANIVYYQDIIEGSLKYHSRLLSTQDISQLLACTFDFCQQKIKDNLCKVNKNTVFFTIRFIRCAFNACSPAILSHLNAQVTTLLATLQSAEYLQFQEQTLELIHAYFDSQQKFADQHLLVAQSCIKTYKSSGNYELCLVIFSRIITIASQLSIPVMLIFRQLSNIIKQMKSIGEKEEKRLYQELLIIEYCIRSKGQSLGFDKITSLILRLQLLLEKSASPIIGCRALNIMLASRKYAKIEPTNWAFVIQVAESFRMPYDQQLLAVMKIEMLVQDISASKKVQEYANILKFLDKILRVTNRKAKVIEPICGCSQFIPFSRQEEAADQKAKKIVLNILKKKRFNFRLIEERLSNDEIRFLRGIEFYGEEASIVQGVKAISFLYS